MAKKLELPKSWNVPWEQRGFGVYLEGTNKRVFEVPIAYKSSKETKQIIDFIVAAINSYKGWDNG